MLIPKSATFTVALVGADGAGKSTIGRRLAATLRLPVKYVYMGDNLDSANWSLPTTRLLRAVRRARGLPLPHRGPPDPNAAARDGRRARGRLGLLGALSRVLGTAKDAARLVNRLAEEWYRQAVAWQFLRRGYIVVFDRHFFADYYAHHIAVSGAGRPFAARLHGVILLRVYPRPDLVVCLDAPAEVLLARKGEGTLASLERRRREYFAIRQLVGHFAVVDASRPVDSVAGDVAALIEALYRERLHLSSEEAACATP
jgi:thymidylate kinase